MGLIGRIFLSLFLFLPACLLGQQKGPALELSEQLKSLEKQYALQFTYNYSLLGQIQLEESLDCSNAQDCIRALERALPVVVEEQGSGQYLIIPKRVDLRFQARESDTQSPLSILGLKLNQEEEIEIRSQQGFFELKQVFLLDSLRFSSPYREPLFFRADELASRTSALEFRPEMILLQEVFITDYLTKGIDARVSDHSFLVSMNSLGLLAGETDGDIFNIIKNVPGIHTPSGKPGTLNFRGTTWDQTIIQIDDIPIYHNGHFFGALSPFNPAVVDQIEIQRGTLSANWGGRVGGLINMKSSTQIPEKATYEVLANTVYGGLQMRLPLVQNKMALLLAGRSNYPGLNSPKLTAFSELNFQGSRLEEIASEINSEDFELGFYDLNAQWLFKPNTKHNLSLHVIDIQNRLSARLEEDSQGQRDFRDLDLDNWGISGKWAYKPNEKLDLESRWSSSSLRISNKSQGFSGGQRNSFEQYTNTIKDSRFITSMRYKNSDRSTLQGGYSLMAYDLTFDQQFEADNGPERRNQDAVVHSLFLSQAVQWNPDLSIEWGLHSDFYTPNQKLYLDPRLTMSYRLGNGLFLKSSAGRSRQFIQQKLREDFDDFNDQTQFWFLPDRTTGVLSSVQAMTGALYEKRGWLVDLEYYIRRTNNITQNSPEPDYDPIQVRSWGIDLLVKKKWNKIEGLMSYSLGKTQTKEEQTRPIYFDQRHLINFTLMWHLNRFELAATWGYYSGMPVNIPAFVLENESPVRQDLLALGDRFDGQHQLDLSATFQFPKEPSGWEGIIGVSFVNFYDNQNVVNLYQNAVPNDNPFREAIRFSPNIQLQFRF